MKKLFVIALLLLAMILPALADTDLSPLIGTWVNPENNPIRKIPKIVYKADGTGGEYATTYAITPSYAFAYTVGKTGRMRSVRPGIKSSQLKFIPSKRNFGTS
jgi:hypothetical protein